MDATLCYDVLLYVMRHYDRVRAVVVLCSCFACARVVFALCSCSFCDLDVLALVVSSRCARGVLVLFS